MQIRTLMKHQQNAVSVAAEAVVGQFIFPTGTGKSLIESHIVIDAIRRNPGFAVYMITLPRILLAHQIFEDIWTEVVLNAGIEALMYSLHCDKSKQQTDIVKGLISVEDADIDKIDQSVVAEYMKRHNINSGNSFLFGTSASQLRKQIEIAKIKNVPLIICSTYHSGYRIAKALEGEELEVLICDEAHNSVSKEFSYVHDLPAKKRFYFTATRKLTDGDEGLGMQNESKFGPILSTLSPAAAIHDKLIVRPRLHFVAGTAQFAEGEEHKADTHAITISFKKHAQMVNKIGAKLLVACRGTSEIKQIVDSTEYFKKLRSSYPSLKVFSIYSGEDACRINGVVKSRKDFMSELQSMKDHEQAIILHYDILSEGIDVPGITGVLPLRNLGTAKFLQTLGRATRLHFNDRANREDRKTKDEGDDQWDDEWVKPYAWVIIPEYGIMGNEIKSSIATYVKALRDDWGWIPHEDVYISEASGEKEPEVLSSLYEQEKKIPKIVEEMLELNQQIEDREQAAVINANLSKMSVEELLDMGL